MLAAGCSEIPEDAGVGAGCSWKKSLMIHGSSHLVRFRSTCGDVYDEDGDGDEQRAGPRQVLQSSYGLIANWKITAGSWGMPLISVLQNGCSRGEQQGAVSPLTRAMPSNTPVRFPARRYGTDDDGDFPTRHPARLRLTQAIGNQAIMFSVVRTRPARRSAPGPPRPPPGEVPSPQHDEAVMNTPMMMDGALSKMSLTNRTMARGATSDRTRPDVPAKCLPAHHPTLQS